MKKLTKSVVSLALVVVMLVCLCGTAFATYSSLWKNFPDQYYGNENNTVHTYAVQAILYRYSANTRDHLTNGGIIGVDGSFGSGTRDAVAEFQDVQDLELIDGWVGDDTWEELWNVLTVYSSSSSTGYIGYSVYRGLSGEAVYRQYYNAPGVSINGWWARNDYGTACKFY